MSLTLDSFEQVIPKRVLSRGLAYFKDGRVSKLSYSEGDALWEAVVEGTETYEVLIEGADESELECECSCPYEAGEHCKHVAAVLYAIVESRKTAKQKKTRGTSQKEESPKERLMRLLAEATKERLVEVIVEAAQADQPLMNRIIVRLDGAHARAQDYEQLVNDALKVAGGKDGFYDYQEAKRAGRAINKMVAEARKWLQAGEATRAVTMWQAAIDVVNAAIAQADDSDGALGGCIELAVEALSQSVELLSQPEQEALFAYCLDRASRTEFLVWDWGWELLDIAGDMVTEEERRSVYLSTLDRIERSLSVKRESAWYREYDLERIALRRLSLIERLDGDAAAEEFLRAHLELNRLRHILIDRYLESGRLGEAEVLIQDGIAHAQKSKYAGLVSDYRSLLMQVRQRQGNTPEVVALARENWLSRPDEALYKVMRQNVPEEEWRQFVDRLIASSRRDTRLVAWLYAQDNRWAELLELLPKAFEAEGIADRYRVALERYFPTEMAVLYLEWARKHLGGQGDRSAYKQVAGYLKRMKALVAPAEVDAIVVEMRNQYPKRRALLDELSRI